MIRLSHVNKDYVLDGDVFHALKDISLTINKGEFASILGPSGCGKSTLMHLIGLLDTPTSGDIFVGEKDSKNLNDDGLSQMRNEVIGFVFQQFNLINKLTVQENIILPTVYSRKKLDFQPQIRAFELMKRFDIDSKAMSYPNKLSGGQQQRVAIARALINKPELILADEPTGNLDSVSGRKIMELLTQLNRTDGITVVIVTHEKAIADKTKHKIHIFDGVLI
jgi:putative ABC transport system ATP-binding protein